jgi:pimeloyl-ACP methyl ester carboxylesterase
MPVFAAWARHDRILAWTRSRPAVLAIPDVRTQLFDGSHAAFLEDPDAFATALREFIENL